MELRPGYKQTEAGIVPEDWDISAVGQEFEIQLGKMLDAERNRGALKPYLGNKSVQWGRIDAANLPMVPMSRQDIDRFRLRPGDLLVCEGGEIGRAAIWKAPIAECYFQKALHRLRPIRDFDPRLMLAFLRYWTERGMLANYVTQTSIAHLAREKLAAVPLPIPALQERRAIATVLGDVDELLVGLERLIAKKRDLKQAAMQQLLTGKQRLAAFAGKSLPGKRTDVGMIPEDWEVRRLRLCLSGTPDYGISAPAVPYSDKLPTYIRITDISTQGRFAPDTRVSVAAARAAEYFLEERDLVFARTGASVGKSYLYNPRDGKLVFGGFLVRVRPDSARLLAAYLAAYATSSPYWNWVRMMSARSGQPGINGNEYGLLPIRLPPLPEQAAIAGVLSDMDAEIVALEARVAKSRLLKQGMMQELLTGRIRLV